LKDGGIITIVTDNAQYYRWSVMQEGKIGIRHEEGHEKEGNHYCIFYPRNMERLITLAGFRALEAHYIDTKHSKADAFAKLLVRLGIWRIESLSFRFEVRGKKGIRLLAVPEDHSIKYSLKHMEKLDV